MSTFLLSYFPTLFVFCVNIESILHGASVPRNKLLFNHGINLLPYTGAGSGGYYC